MTLLHAKRLPAVSVALLGLLLCPRAAAEDDAVIRAVLEDPFGGCVALLRGQPLLDACDRAIRGGTYSADNRAMGHLHLARARSLTMSGDRRIDEAIAAAEAAVAADRTNEYAAVYEAHLKYLARDDHAAVAAVARRFPRNPYAALLPACLRLKTDPAAAEKVIASVLAMPDLPRAAKAEAHYQQALIHLQYGEYDRCIGSVDSAIAHCTGSALSSPLGGHDAQSLLGFRLQVAHRAGRFELTEADALELVLRQPGNPVYAHTLVVTQIDLGRPLTAAAAAEGVADRFPTYSQRPVLLAAAYNRVGRHKEAVAALADYAHPDAASLTEQALALWGIDNRPSALDKLDAALKKEDAFAPAVALRAVLRATDPKATADEKTLATADAKRAVDLDPTNSYGFVATMLAAAASDDYPAAVAAAETALKLSRRPPPITDEIAKARDAYKAKRSHPASAELIRSVNSYRLPDLSAR